jgi:hypothetical protein
MYHINSEHAANLLNNGHQSQVFNINNNINNNRSIEQFFNSNQLDNINTAIGYKRTECIHSWTSYIV